MGSGGESGVCGALGTGFGDGFGGVETGVGFGGCGIGLGGAETGSGVNGFGFSGVFGFG